jgi:hypothetical protein
MASPIRALADEVQAGFAGFRPENITDLRSLMTDLPDFWDQLADGIRGLAARFDEELPIDPKVAESVREMGATIVGLGEHCREMSALFEQVHEPELRRLDEPRANEEMWDVNQNK